MDTDAVLELMKNVAADVITPRFRRLADSEVIEKNPGDLVTVADREAETLITAAIQAQVPGVLVVGEEATEADPGLLDALETADRAWVVDPVDGTKNFVHGRPDYAVMVAELRRGRTVRGWIWQPEHGHAYVAERGAGVRRNGEPVHRPAPATDPADLNLLTSRPASQGRHGAITLGPTAWCCGVDYPWIIEGRADAVLYTRSMPWDHAAGALFVEETGGCVRYEDGTPYLPGRRHPGHLIAAATPAVWSVVVHETTGLD